MLSGEPPAGGQNNAAGANVLTGKPAVGPRLEPRRQENDVAVETPPDVSTRS